MDRSSSCREMATAYPRPTIPEMPRPGVGGSPEPVRAPDVAIARAPRPERKLEHRHAPTHASEELTMRRPVTVPRLVLAQALLLAWVLPGAAGAATDQPRPAVRLAQAAGASATRSATLRGTVVALDGARLRV